MWLNIAEIISWWGFNATKWDSEATDEGRVFLLKKKPSLSTVLFHVPRLHTPPTGYFMPLSPDHTYMLAGCRRIGARSAVWRRSTAGTGACPVGRFFTWQEKDLPGRLAPGSVRPFRPVHDSVPASMPLLELLTGGGRQGTSETMPMLAG